ncbi:hypothetical protein KC19_6G172800 [Ceratodon purpureus]|uniref:Uncharacterized protein n=1 Tax=Ceratodon purpureus TaxID=3225 RepID=A0A8T0HFP3_CERPU|nr:hypothetical protein KC19_6G172800 [Ceratodon purpureus]
MTSTSQHRLHESVSLGFLLFDSPSATCSLTKSCVRAGDLQLPPRCELNGLCMDGLLDLLLNFTRDKESEQPFKDRGV